MQEEAAPAVQPLCATCSTGTSSDACRQLRRSAWNDNLSDADIQEAPSGLLGSVAAERALIASRLRAEVRAQLQAARRRMETNPVGVAGSLKNLLNMVETQPDVDPIVRQELEAQVRQAIEVSSRREAAHVEAMASRAEVVAAATQTEQLLNERFRREDRLQTLSNQMNSLIDQGKYDEADANITLAIAEVAGTELAGQS